MKAKTPLLLTVALLLTTAANPQERGMKLAGSDSGRRVALVIGNGAYADAPLRNPVNDAQDIAHALRELGFDVTHRENLNQSDMKRAIRDFGQKLRGRTTGLFYFAGHGVQVKGVNYLIPVGARVNSEEEVEYEGVDAGFVLAQMEAAGNGMNVVILDACRNNPFARSFRSASRGLAMMDAPSGSMIAYATAPGSVASDGGERNGLYTQELLKFMRTPGLDIEDVFKRVRVSVRNGTQGKQTPWESSSLTGDFYFAPHPAGGQAPPAVLAAEGSPGDATAPRPNTTDAISGVPEETELTITLSQSLSTETARWGDRFMAKVSAPPQYEGSVIEGHLDTIFRGKNIKGMSQMTLEFESIRLPDGRTFRFHGNLHSKNVRERDGKRLIVDSLNSRVVNAKGEDFVLPEGTQLVIRSAKPLGTR